MVTVPERDDARELTVGQAAALVGVTVRTLHHWDEIGLAQPSERSSAGYRMYTADDVARLRRIVVYRELGVDLPAIRGILDDPASDVVATLREQRMRLADRIRQLQDLDADLGRMIEAQERGILLSAEQQTRAFGEGWNTQWPGEAREHYGDTAQWRQYAEGAAKRSADDWQAIAARTTDLNRALAAAMDAGVVPGDAEADALAERHREVFSAYFPLSREMQVLLGRMYEADPAFTAHYDEVREGLTSWLRQIIDANARSRGIDPDAATWR